ncbi:leukocyte surface antigen CD47 isoform X2 [Varanus komodoensis]|uniref:leukocyte surface antigen CD47 isoform X2 n=1 Tax=Varanus komodoensis TaxID=61221 RepID=UPI001CF77B7B|nr:leukocyte surface antigen CD47 isoform X2 [Varanus komodoensis]
MWALRVCWVLLGTVGAGSAQLMFQNVTSVKMDSCNQTVLIPCKIINLKLNDTKQMFLKWKVQGNFFFSYDGSEETFFRNSSFQSANVSLPELRYGNASVSLSKLEAVPGNYTCEVAESNREGKIIVELVYNSEWTLQHSLIIASMIVAAFLYWAQLGAVAIKFDVTFSKKIGLSIPGIIVTGFAVIGSILFASDAYGASILVGLGLIVIPAIILVPLLYFLFTSVFEKQPLFAIILVALKALGYLIALVGFALSDSACLPKQGSVVIAGLVIIDIVAAIGLIYILVIGCNLKDHQPPRKAVEESLNDAKGVMLE